jgi:hypothetical protein
VADVDRRRSTRRGPIAFFAPPTTRAKRLEEPASLRPFAMDALARAYDEGGLQGVTRYLQDHPPTIAALAAHRPAEVDAAFDAAFERTGVFVLPGAARHATTVAIAAILRERVFEEGRAIVEQRIERLTVLRDALPAVLATLRGAAPGSEDAALAASLGARGDDGDLERAEAAVTSAIDAHARFLGRLYSPTEWRNVDFPASSHRAAAALGFANPSPGSLGEEALIDGTDALAFRECVDGDALTACSVAVSILTEAVPALRVPASVIIGMHHVALEDHRAFVEVGRSIGM